MLIPTESHRVKSQLLSSLTAIGRSLFSHAELHDKLIDTAKLVSNFLPILVRYLQDMYQQGTVVMILAGLRLVMES